MRILDKSDQVHIIKALVATLDTADHLARLLRDNAGPDPEQMRVSSIVSANTDMARGWAVMLQGHIEARA